MGYSQGRAFCVRLLDRVGNLGTNRTRHGGCLVLGVLSAMLLITGCGEGDTPSPVATAEVSHTYHVRGVVLEVLPDALMIHHQAIDDYIGPQGKIVGMDPMVMRFQLAPKLRMDDFHARDVLEFRFEDRPQGQVSVIVEAHRVPPGTALDFRAARPREAQ